jgi:hypothetical protein
MRWIVGIMAVLFCLGWFACHIEVVLADTSLPRAEDGWRRTTRGWERHVTANVVSAAKVIPFWQRHPHPLVATLLLIMLSVLLLVAFTEGAFFDATSENSRLVNRDSVTA